MCPQAGHRLVRNWTSSRVEEADPMEFGTVFEAGGGQDFGVEGVEAGAEGSTLDNKGGGGLVNGLAEEAAGAEEADTGDGIGVGGDGNVIGALDRSGLGQVREEDSSGEG